MGKEQATQLLASLLSQGVPEWIVESLIKDDGVDMSKIATIQSSLDDGTFQEADFIPHDESFNPFGDREESMRATEQKLGIDPESINAINEKFQGNYEDTLNQANQIQPGASDTLTPNAEEITQYPTAKQIQIDNPDTMEAIIPDIDPLPMSGISGPNVINPTTGVIGAITPVNPSQLTNSKKTLFGTGQGALANWKPGQNIAAGRGIFGKQGGFGSGGGGLANWSPFGHMKPQTVTTPGPLGGQAFATTTTVPGQGLFGKDSGFGSGAGKLSEIPGKLATMKETINSKLDRFAGWEPGQGECLFGKEGGFASGEGALSQWEPFGHMKEGKGLFGKDKGFGSSKGKIGGVIKRIKDNILYDKLKAEGRSWGELDTWGGGGLRKRGIFTGKEDGFGTGRGALSQWSPFEKGMGIFGKEGGFGSGEGALSQWSPFQQGFGSGEGKLAQWSPFQNVKEGKGLFGKEGGFGSGEGALAGLAENIKGGKGLFGKEGGFGSGQGALANILGNIKTEGKGVFGKEGGFGSGLGKINVASSALKKLGQKLFGKKASKVTKPIEKLFGSLTKERDYLGGTSILQAMREMPQYSQQASAMQGYGEPDFYYGGGGGGYTPPSLNPIMNTAMQSHHDWKKGKK